MTVLINSACIPTDIELSYRLLLSLHSINAVSVYPSLINSWILPLKQTNKCFSWTTLRGKHYFHPFAVMWIGDMLGPGTVTIYVPALKSVGFCSSKDTATLLCDWLRVQKAGALYLKKNLYGLGFKILLDLFGEL